MNMTLLQENTFTLTDSILFLGFGEPYPNLDDGLADAEFGVAAFDNAFKAIQWLNERKDNELPTAIVCALSFIQYNEYGLHYNFGFLNRLKEDSRLRNIPLIALKDAGTELDCREAMRLGIDDCYNMDEDWVKIWKRIEFLRQFKPKMKAVEKENIKPYRTPLAKRMLDILIASAAILALSPILILIAVAIKLESRGSIIYKSKRVGRGYEVFHFLKFRSMYPDADKRLKELQHLNQYKAEGNNAFVKIKNDPRITKVGSIIRKTSLDELPQLFNVLRGDMSIVGNRPLPLYEAEKLTRDEWSTRFLAPAGITGLWQVTKRGKDDMSTQERMDLDITYAKEFSFWFDMKIILKTLPAMIQQENV